MKDFVDDGQTKFFENKKLTNKQDFKISTILGRYSHFYAFFKLQKFYVTECE